MSVLFLKRPGVIQPSGPAPIPGAFVWLAPVAGVAAAPGKGGRFVNPSAAITVGTVPFAIAKRFTVVTVYCHKAASQAQTEVFRIGAGSTGVRWDFATTAGGANPDTWTLNGVANGTNQLRSVVFDTRPRVNVASFDAATFEVTSGELGGADMLTYVQTASMIVPSNGSVVVQGGPIQFYAIVILPYRVARAVAVGLVLNPWQLFSSRQALWLGDAPSIFSVSSLESFSAADFPSAALTLSSDIAESITITATESAVNSVTRPSSDVTTTGWTATPGPDLFDMIDEVAASDTDFITSPDLTSGASTTIHGLSQSLAVGTYTVRFRSEKATAPTRSVRIHLMDGTSAIVGSSGWQAVTASYALYEVSITTSALATRVGIEAQ